MRIKCPVCNEILGSVQEYNLHSQNVHKDKPLKKERLREMVLVE